MSQKYTVVELRKLCKEKGLKGYSKMKKDELMKLCFGEPSTQVTSTQSNTKPTSNKEQWIFTDGSCINNGKQLSCGGYGVFFGDNDERNVAKKAEGKTTNNKEELKAILHALKIIQKDPKNKYVIYSDSQYSINAITIWSKNWAKKNWRKSDGKPVENKEIISEAYEIYNNLNNVKFIHVRSHKKAPTDKSSTEYKIWYGNDMADKLANKYN